MTRPHWFRWWFGTEQVTWTNVVHVLWRNMSSLGINELNIRYSIFEGPGRIYTIIRYIIHLSFENTLCLIKFIRHWTSLIMLFCTKWVGVQFEYGCQPRENHSGEYWLLKVHYNDVIIGAITFQITGVSIVSPNVCSGADQRTHQCSASLVFVRGIHRWPVNFPHNGPVTQKMFPRHHDSPILTVSDATQGT